MAITERLTRLAAEADTTSEYDPIGDFTFVSPFSVRVPVYQGDAP